MLMLATKCNRWILLMLTVGLIFLPKAATHADAPIVLAAGYYTDTQGGTMPCYWRNGHPVKLPIADNAAGKANCIGQMDGHIYVGGYFKDASGIEKPCYWDNDVLIPLPLIVPSKNGRVQSIAFYNHEVFLGGYCFNQSMAIDRCYWRGTRLISWANSPQETGSNSYSILINQGDIYLSGCHDTPMGATSVSVFIPCYWKNTGLNNLPVIDNEARNGWAVSMAFYHNQLIIAGYLNDFSSPPTPCYWMDNRNIALPVLVAKNGGWTSSIAVSESAIYIAGYCKDKTGVNKPCLWRNESIQVLSTIDPKGEGFARSVWASGGQVYIAGSSRNKTGYQTACCWNNGLRTDLPNPEKGSDSVANSIFVAD